MAEIWCLKIIRNCINHFDTSYTNNNKIIYNLIFYSMDDLLPTLSNNSCPLFLILHGHVDTINMNQNDCMQLGQWWMIEFTVEFISMKRIGKYIGVEKRHIWNQRPIKWPIESLFKCCFQMSRLKCFLFLHFRESCFVILNCLIIQDNISLI